MSVVIKELTFQLLIFKRSVKSIDNIPVAFNKREVHSISFNSQNEGLNIMNIHG